MRYTSYDNVGLVKILNFLKTHQEEYLSGEDLSDVLKISRVAIWKHIKKIKELGYEIESKQKMGYRLVRNTDLTLPWEITENLETKTLGQRAYYFDSTSSTQEYALQIARNQNEDGAIIIAQKQTASKGRLGRKWISPKGGLWFSIIIHPKFDVSNSTILPIAVSVAMAKTIEEELGYKPELKWPNDVNVNGKKVAGILLDAVIQSNKIESMVIGIGVNYFIDSDKLSKTITDKSNFYGAESLVKKESDNHPVKFMQKFLIELEKMIQKIESKKISSIIKEWTKHSTMIGKQVTVTVDKEKFSGIAEKIDSDGALILSNGKDKKQILAGDVAQIRSS